MRKEVKGTVITVQFFLPTTNVDEAFQAVHNVVGESNDYSPSISLWNEAENTWYYGAYDIDTDYKGAIFTVDEDNEYEGLVDIDADCPVAV